MSRRGLRPRDVAYCALITAHSMAGGPDAALAVRRRMAREGAAASVHVYNALLAACDRAGRYEQALELLQAMKLEVRRSSCPHARGGAGRAPALEGPASAAHPAPVRCGTQH